MAKIKDSEKIKKLMRKVKALADKGDSGEKVAAQSKLKSLMNKYDIQKFEESKIKKRTFKLSNFDDSKTIMVHCILDAVSSCDIEGSLQRKELYASMTDEQYINVLEKFNHYYPEYIKQKESFLLAFILKNNLGVSNTGEDSEHEPCPEKIVNFMQTMNASPYKKTKCIN